MPRLTARELKYAITGHRSYTTGNFITYNDALCDYIREILPEADDLYIFVYVDYRPPIRCMLQWRERDQPYDGYNQVHVVMPQDIRIQSEFDAYKWMMEQLVSRYRLMRYIDGADKVI